MNIYNETEVKLFIIEGMQLHLSDMEADFWRQSQSLNVARQQQMMNADKYPKDCTHAGRNQLYRWSVHTLTSVETKRWGKGVWAVPKVSHLKVVYYVF